MPIRPELTFEAGFPLLQYTQVPDRILDNLNAFGDAELRVLLYVVRHTLGWGKQSDRISLSQMINGVQRRDGTNIDWGTGLGRTAIVRAIKSLEERDALVVERQEIKAAREGKRAGRSVNTYRLHLAKGVVP